METDIKDLEQPQPRPAPDWSETELVPEQRQPAELFAREIIETLLLTLFIFWIVNSATGRFRIEGQSMLPTLEEGEYIIINKLSYAFDEPQRGDIIVLRFPNDRSRDFIKRVIGLPGDVIEVSDKEVRVNGVVLNEPYIRAAPTYDGRWTVPEGHYFVMGDNRNNSSDSHNWSFLPRDDIVGKAWIIYWSPEHWGLVPHHQHNLG
ncbi:MAG: signal peptidase I [Chloroflexi bacterium]|nr:signal peptidase I [Chloroflexota bacterium]MCI0578459.1 signal peptidase I [Chloroflexota bacterium]MCI0643905.1 signal peptidase I [Chloroflexota bacterium]MCI0729185.1 signal peptidase I [Chloroflexota bacterium]